ncbi:hypothetical protein E3N88_12885 [Mikania micrantha]|uniref:AB hydrolase-1 domain-containing protein n=1 Tax=Mikania micrantha TaxID=192012 RepID=A0A5N6P9R0_9ASTR|nr:hypothetical protein E3N88_12885 [Mikania micrantha]
MGERELKKPHFVFIHGVGGGSWCWYKVKCLMVNSGYTVTCLDLRGAGIDPSDPNKILWFDDYNKPLIDFLTSLPDHEQVILVGHSAGGLSVTDAIHKFSKKISLAVYIAATMLKNGFLTQQDFKDDFTLATMLLRPAPVYALQSAMFKDIDEGAKNVPRVYIKTMYDRIVKPEQQDKMIAKWPPSNVYVIESDHSPNFSNPFVLCGILVEAYLSICHSSA